MGILITMGDDSNYIEQVAWVAESPYAEQNISNYIEIEAEKVREHFDAESFYADWHPIEKELFSNLMTDLGLTTNDLPIISD